MKNIKKFTTFVKESINNMKMNIVGKMKDNFLGVDYTVATTSAKELSSYLKENIKNRNLDIESFNRTKYSEYDKEKEVEKNPPIELYEYQPFFLLKKDDGEYLLLDGFRRLLWYNSPDHQINIRIYDEANMPADKIIKMLVYLNHFKFYTNGAEYYDRGFALAMKVIFDFNITTFYNAFDGYLSSKEINKGYGSEWGNSGNQKNITIKDRILNPHFVEDMKFLQDLKEGDQMVNTQFGALLYQYRNNNPDVSFNSSEFIKLAKTPTIEKLLVKFGKSSGEHQRNAINELIEEYKNIFDSLLGGEKKETYNDLLNKAKELSANIKKDKAWTKITGNRSIYRIENEIYKFIEETKKSPKFKVVVYPNKDVKYECLPVGVYDDFIVTRYVKRGNLGKEVEVLNSNKTIKIGISSIKDFHAVAVWNRIRDVNSIPSKTSDVDVFVSFK